VIAAFLIVELEAGLERLSRVIAPVDPV